MSTTQEISNTLFEYGFDTKHIASSDAAKVITTIQGKKGKCIRDGCDKKASFNIKTAKYAIYCKDHKSSDMINIVRKPKTTETASSEVLTEDIKKLFIKDENKPSTKP